MFLKFDLDIDGFLPFEIQTTRAEYYGIKVGRKTDFHQNLVLTPVLPSPMQMQCSTYLALKYYHLAKQTYEILPIKLYIHIYCYIKIDAS